MYVAVDVGGTKTLVALFSKDGQIVKKDRFPTPKKYADFIDELKNTWANFGEVNTTSVGIAVPGRVDRKKGIGEIFGNLPWKNVPIRNDAKKLFKVPVVVENDANAAGVSEAKFVINDFKKVLYVTISTGIGTGVIVNGAIDPELADSEGGHIMLRHGKRLEEWEDFASGQAIEKEYGRMARDISSASTWHEISEDIAAGLIDLIAVVQPDIIIIGGGVGAHFDKFGYMLANELKKLERPLTPIPPIRQAKHPEEAVLYGCYELAKTVK